MSQIDFYLEYDHSARRRTTAYGMGTGAFTGALTELISNQFWLAFIACIIVTGAVEIVSAYWYEQPSRKERRILAAQPIRRNLIWAAASGAFLFATSRLRGLNPYLETLAYEKNLQRASADPTDPSNITQVRKVLAKAEIAQVQIDPADLKKTGQEFVRAANQDPAAWDAALEFVRYKSYINSKSELIPDVSKTHPPYRTLYWFPRPPEGVPDVLLAHVGIVPELQAAQLNRIGQDFNSGEATGDAYLVGTGGVLYLDGLQARNVVLINVQIVYNGGPVELTNVYFVNCAFEMKAAPNTKNLALALLEPPPSTNFSGM